MRYRRKLRICFAITKEQIKTEWSVPRVWLGYLLGICIALVKTADYRGYCNGNAMQIYEPFILIMNDYMNFSLVLLGLFVVLVDAPFINSRSIYTAVRGSRRSWYWGMILYIVFQTFVYYLAIFGATALFCMNTAYVKNVWSQSFYILGAFQPLEALTQWGLSFQGEDIVKYLTPAITFSVTYFMGMLYSLLLLFLAFLINMNGRWILGNVISVLVHLLSIVLIKSAYVAVLIRFSPLAYSQLVYRIINENGIETLYRSWIFFGTVLGVILLLGHFLVKGTDFVIARGDRES